MAHRSCGRIMMTIGAVGEDVAQPRESVTAGSEHGRRPVAVLDIGGTPPRGGRLSPAQ